MMGVPPASKLGKSSAGLHPRPLLSRPRTDQCRRSTAVGPGMDRLRYPGRGRTVGASVWHSSLSSFARGGAAQKVTPRLADNRVESGTRNRTICEPKVEGHLWPVSVDWFEAVRGFGLPLLPKGRIWPLRCNILHLVRVDDADLSLPDPPSSKDLGELYIGEINRADRLLLPVSIGPYGDFGPIFRNSFLAKGPASPCPRSRTDRKPTSPTCAPPRTPPPSMSSPQHAPTGSATSPDISLAILTRHLPHANISSRSLGSTPQKPSPSCSTTHSSTSSAPRPASRPPIGPRPGPTTAPHTFSQILP
ncbi:hypothetical protein THAOC_28900 [Thalassiosira oceanica]|uniref:Uncharacterized protein n=1 Tax=Thalassiosira oceanica TaxID=159749 RepID=K0RF66_THAOC|nr:hypothetical protein THAOC_28900 [Thalassiosira oceanica]|eukprot:EJK51885.1 hypothetical protein THAOC_28900 [Thalassiosira oceanica]